MRTWIITYNVILVMTEILENLQNSHRWMREHGPKDQTYNELNKQGLNAIATFVLMCYAKNEGIIREEQIPLISMHRSMFKTVKGDVNDSFLIKCANKLGIAPSELREKFIDVGVIDKIRQSPELYGPNANKVADEFANFMSEIAKSEGNPIEKGLFKAGTKIATLIEAVELDDVNIVTEVLASLELFSDIPGFEQVASIDPVLDEDGKLCGYKRKPTDTPEFAFLCKISKTRQTIRWDGIPKSCNCSDLGHLYETAVYSYLIAKSAYYSDEDAARCFFVGLFHDIAEIWTGDIKTPIKDGVIVNNIPLRNVIEELENEAMQKHVYEALPEFIGNEIKFNFIEDDSVPKEIRKIVVLADHMSAVSELKKINSTAPEVPMIMRRYIQGDKKELETIFQMFYDRMYEIALKSARNEGFFKIDVEQEDIE